METEQAVVRKLREFLCQGFNKYTVSIESKVHLAALGNCVCTAAKASTVLG